jgi:hypothetical protein
MEIGAIGQQALERFTVGVRMLAREQIEGVCSVNFRCANLPACEHACKSGTSNGMLAADHTTHPGGYS